MFINHEHWLGCQNLLLVVWRVGDGLSAKTLANVDSWCGAGIAQEYPPRTKAEPRSGRYGCVAAFDGGREGDEGLGKNSLRFVSRDFLRKPFAHVEWLDAKMAFQVQP